MDYTISEAILGRRTSKTSLSKPVPKEVIFDLLEKASYAPYHKHEPWMAKIATTDSEKEYLFQKIIATLKRNGTIHDAETEERMMTKMTRLIKNAPATIIFARELIPESPRLDYDSIEATSALIQNFSLLAWEADLVGFWASSAFILDQTLAEDLGFPDNYQIIANYRLGYRDHEKTVREAKRQPLENWASSIEPI